MRAATCRWSPQPPGLRRRRQTSSVAHVADVAAPGVDRVDSWRVDVEAVTSKPAFAELHGERQADVPEADDADPGLRFRILCFSSKASPSMRFADLTGITAAARRRRKPRDVGVDHHRHQLLECHRRLPSERALSPCSRRQSGDRLPRDAERRIDAHVLLPVETGVTERDLHELLHRVADAGRDDVIVGLVLLQHQPHRAHVVAGKAPVATRVEVAERRGDRRVPA